MYLGLFPIAFYRLRALTPRATSLFPIGFP